MKCDSPVVVTDQNLRSTACKTIELDQFNVRDNYHDLCRAYNCMKHAREFGPRSESALRQRFDDLFRLVFRNHLELASGDDYWHEVPIDLVHFDWQMGMSVYPNSQVKVNGGIVNAVSISYAAPALPDHLLHHYESSIVEYKFGDDNYTRQAILASASLQGINRLLRLKDVVNYAFSVHGLKGEVDVIVSSWREDDNNDYRYLYKTIRSAFNVQLPFDFFRFHSFLCHLRDYHKELVKMINEVDVEKLNLRSVDNPFAQHKMGEGNSKGKRAERSQGTGFNLRTVSEQDDDEMKEAEGSEISFGEEAGMGEIPFKRTIVEVHFILITPMSLILMRR